MNIFVTVALTNYMIQGVSFVAHLVKNPLAMQETLVSPWARKISWRREKLPTPVCWPGEFHGWYSQWGHKETDTTG